MMAIRSVSVIAGDGPCDNPHEPHLGLNLWRRTMTGLPSGTVTFLFTDIEGSTALWERDRHAMADAVDRHLHLLRAEIEAHDGVLFKTVGTRSRLPFLTLPVPSRP